MNWLIIAALAFFALAIALESLTSRMSAAPYMETLIAAEEIEGLRWANCECIEKNSCPVYELQPQRREQRDVACRWIDNHRRALCEFEVRDIDIADWGGGDLPGQELKPWERWQITVRGDRRHHEWCIVSAKKLSSNPR